MFVKQYVVKLVIFTDADASTTIIVVHISNQRMDHHWKQFYPALLVKTLDLLTMKIAQIVFKPKVVKDQSSLQILMSNQSKLNEKVEPTI
jgi:hypothetical protein